MNFRRTRSPAVSARVLSRFFWRISVLWQNLWCGKGTRKFTWKMLNSIRTYLQRHHHNKRVEYYEKKIVNSWMFETLFELTKNCCSCRFFICSKKKNSTELSDSFHTEKKKSARFSFLFFSTFHDSIFPKKKSHNFHNFPLSFPHALEGKFHCNFIAKKKLLYFSCLLVLLCFTLNFFFRRTSSRPRASLSKNSNELNSGFLDRKKKCVWSSIFLCVARILYNSFACMKMMIFFFGALLRSALWVCIRCRI